MSSDPQTVSLFGYDVPVREKMTVKETILLQRALLKAAQEGHGQLWQDVEAAKILISTRNGEKFSGPAENAHLDLTELNEAVATLLEPFMEAQYAVARRRAATPDDTPATTVRLLGYDVPLMDDMIFGETVDLEKAAKKAEAGLVSQLEQNFDAAAALVKHRLKKTFVLPSMHEPLPQDEADFDAAIRRLVRPFFKEQAARLQSKMGRRTAAQSPLYRQAIANLEREQLSLMEKERSPFGSS